MANSLRDVAKERSWRDVVRRYAGSGLSVREFCRRESLAEASFYAWRRTLAERDAAATTPMRGGGRPKQLAFLPVRPSALRGLFRRLERPAAAGADSG